MKFSTRTSWLRQPNQLTSLLEKRKSQGIQTLDLTVTNPTDCGLFYPQHEILSALSNDHALCYQPDPKGLFSARNAIAQYYHAGRQPIDPEQILVTASTSEAYSHVFKLLCDPGDTVLVPAPSYPLFEYLAQLHDVCLQDYMLFYDHGWHIDIESLRINITERTKGIVIVNPHNPTGMFIKPEEYLSIKQLAQTFNLSLIIDEVFIDFPLVDSFRPVRTASEQDVLTFTLNGISKMCGLPQMKLGWIAVSGKPSDVREAIGRLEILSDTYLSVNSPVQVALPRLLQAGQLIRNQILDRCSTNYSTACRLIRNNPQTPVSLLETEGGWCSILRIPSIKSDEDWALDFIEHCNIIVQPGYFFDFKDEHHIVFSLLIPPEIFHAGLSGILNYIHSADR